MLNRQYRSNHHDLAQDFYRKGLPESQSFCRAVGFFSSSVFRACTDSFYEFFSQGGRYRVICSHILSESDVSRLVRGYRDGHKFIRRDLLNYLDGKSTLGSDELDDLVPWLVAKGLLDVKIALPNEFSGAEQYHEKLGVFEDREEAIVSFSGSANETFQALKRNFEVVDVYRSWEADERRRARDKQSDFENLWANETKNLDVMPFPVAARRGLLKARAPRSPDQEENGQLKISRRDSGEPVSVDGLQEYLQIPSYIRLYDHQKTAIRSWLTSNGLGLLRMATGSGKTISALGATTKLYKVTGPPLVILMVAPYLHLVDQWADEAKNFGLEPLICAHGRDHWYEDLQVRIFNANTGRRAVTSVFTTTATFRTEAFQDILDSISAPLLLIGDEAHNLGASNTRKKLPEHANYRLGLSATPDRWHDDEGTEALKDYFGGVLEDAEYTLEQALDDDVLCPYHYYPHPIELTEDEVREYAQLTSRIAKAIASSGDFEEPSEKAKRLLIKRARLLAVAKNKLSALRELMVSRRDSAHILVYCGDGRVESEAASEEVRQIEEVTRMLGRELEMRVATYTAETDTRRRRILRDGFGSGEVQCLVAIRCLDEGVDIPETRSAFILASSSNPRQFIQRRGRILRSAEDKEKAEIHDFLVKPPSHHMDERSDNFKLTRKLFRGELKRAVEFAKLAENGPQAMGELLDIRDQLNLLDIGV